MAEAISNLCTLCCSVIDLVKTGVTKCMSLRCSCSVIVKTGVTECMSLRSSCSVIMKTCVKVLEEKTMNIIILHVVQVSNHRTSQYTPAWIE